MRVKHSVVSCPAAGYCWSECGPWHSQTENRLSSSCGHRWAAAGHTLLVFPGDPGLSAFINEIKAEPGRSQLWPCVYLHQYCMLNIIILEEAFKETCDLQDPAPVCRTNWKLECFHRIQTMSVTDDVEYT